MCNKRSGKFYNKNEKEVMELLGLIPTKMSGAGWLEKEDGYNDNVICQLKSTDANSIRVKLEDIEKLEYQSSVTNKIPIFAIQFLKNISDIDMGTYLLIKPSDLMEVVNYLDKPNVTITNKNNFNISALNTSKNISKIKSSSKAKQQWEKEQEQKWQNYKRGRK